MGKIIFILTLLLGVTFLVNLSCEEKTTTSRERTDFEAIKAIIYENPDIFLVDVLLFHPSITFFAEVFSFPFSVNIMITFFW